MFDKDKFSNILQNINNEYDNMTEFAKKANFDRTYISKYIHKKLNNPPSPNILKKLADASKEITNYDELMEICGYITENFGNNSIVNNNIAVLPLFLSLNGTLEPYTDLWIDKQILEKNHEYFGYKSSDDSMLPLLGERRYCNYRKN